MAPPMVPPLIRLLERTELEVHPTLGTCWIWTGAVNKRRGEYGVITMSPKPHRVRTHRLGWLLLRGPFPPGLVPDHLCRRKRCWNPDHIEWVTRPINAMRQAAATKPTRCPKGHPYTPANIGRNGTSGLRCKTCHREAERARYQRLKAAH